MKEKGHPDLEAKEKKLRVGILSFYYPQLGGAGILTARLGKNLARKGHEIHFIGYDTDIHPSEMEELGIKLHKVRRIDYPALKNEPYIWSLASKICDVDKKFDLDLIHANYALPHAASAYLAREKLKSEGKHLPYIVTGHGSDIHTNGLKNEVNPILQLTLNNADALTFVSKDLKRISEEQLGINNKGIHIPNFVDTTNFYEKETNLREKLKIPEKAFVIGHVSNFAPIKQVYHFSYLSDHLKSAGTLNNVYFLMVGDGRDRASLEERVNKLEVSDHFRFVGRLGGDDILDAYNAMDVVMLPSKHEGNPLTLLEAMACSKPVIGTKVGGIEETIEGGGGFLFEKGDMIELTKIISKLKDNPEFCSSIGKQGLEKVKKDYSVEKALAKYFEIYQRVIGENQ